MSHFFFASRVQGAVHNMVPIDESNRLGRSGRAGSLGLDGVNLLFEYHDVMAIIALGVTAVFYLCVLCLFFWVGVMLWLWICMVVMPFFYYIYAMTRPDICVSIQCSVIPFVDTQVWPSRQVQKNWGGMSYPALLRSCTDPCSWYRAWCTLSSCAYLQFLHCGAGV